MTPALRRPKWEDHEFKVSTDQVAKLTKQYNMLQSLKIIFKKEKQKGNTHRHLLTDLKTHTVAKMALIGMGPKDTIQIKAAALQEMNSNYSLTKFMKWPGSCRQKAD